MDTKIQEATATAAEETIGKFTHRFVDFIKGIATFENLFKIVGAALIIFVMYVVFRLIKKALKKATAHRLEEYQFATLAKIINYIFYVLAVMYVLTVAGVNLNAVWGAAGIAGVAIGFAAQTSVSNLISGLFVLGEKAMKVGDFIVVGAVSGTVDAVGLLSVKIHTLDNQMVRIPNSAIINASFQNNSYFAVRRFTFAVSVSYDTDMPTALAALKRVPAQCPTVLSEPAPNAWFDGFGASGINMTLAVYLNSGDLVQTKNDVLTAIKAAFDKAGITIPFNRVDVKMVEG